MDRTTLQGLLAHHRRCVVERYAPITIGVSNEAYDVTCDDGERYVVRVLGAQTVHSARAEARIQQAMARHGMSTPLYLPLGAGDVVGQEDGIAFTVARFVAGQHPQVATLPLIESIGRNMGTLHGILDPAEIDMGFNTGQWLDPSNVGADLSRCDPKVKRLVIPRLESGLRVFDDRLPMAVVHGELATNNLFAHDDEVTTIFDFETAQHGPRLLDLAFSYLSFVYDGELDPTSVVSQLAKGYNVVTRLTTEEAASFQPAVWFVSAATAAWCFARGYSDYGERFLTAGTHGAPGIELGD
jgi:Ser/Thr protein kinase RdoA (MazF antagonist)